MNEPIFPKEMDSTLLIEVMHVIVVPKHEDREVSVVEILSISIFIVRMLLLKKVEASKVKTY